MATSLKIRKKSSSKRTLLLVIAGILLLAGAAAGTYLYLQSKRTPEHTQSSDVKPRNTVDYSPAKPEDRIGDSSKDEVINGSGQQPTSQSPLTVTLSNTSQEGDGGVVHVRAFTPTSTTGTCTLTLTRGDARVTKTAPLGTQAGYTICQGFDIVRNEFSEPGEWKVQVEIVSTDSSRGSAEATLEIR